MKHESAVLLWNEACQKFFESCSTLTNLGCAATAKDVPVWTTTTTDYELLPTTPDMYKHSLFSNRKIAAFLREWADAIDREAQP